MKISLKKITHDIKSLVDKYPEAYTYSVILEASNAVAELAATTDPSLEEKYNNFADQSNKFLDRLKIESIEDLRKGFLLFVQKPWNMINAAAKTMNKSEARRFLQESTKFFWTTMGEIDKAAQSESEGRRYGAFWIPFLIGATALGGVFAYSSGQSTKEYIEKKEEKTSPIVYAGIGAVAILGVMALLKK